MRVKDVTFAISEAVRFISRAEAALERQNRAQLTASKDCKYEIWEQCQENAACKRASLDLSRALAQLRKP